MAGIDAGSYDWFFYCIICGHTSRGGGEGEEEEEERRRRRRGKRGLEKDEKLDKNRKMEERIK